MEAEMTTMSGAFSPVGPGDGDVEQVVAYGCRAPSVHNTQPWTWRTSGRRIELRADRRRQLPVSDPAGRNLMISCGAALHHALIGAAGLGREVAVTRMPDPADPDLLAVVELGEQRLPTREQRQLLEALETRQTDRRRFTTWPVPEERLDDLAEIAERWGARVLPLTGNAARATVERLIDRARDVQSHDAACVAEQRTWIARGSGEGIPAETLPEQSRPSERQDRFSRRTGPEPVDNRVEHADQVLVICTARDDAASWLDAGETLSALWLRATLAGFSLVPLSQVVEVDETRLALQEKVFFGMAEVQLLARIGWLEISRPPLPRTPRRPLAEVLESVPAVQNTR
jgi:hypothetical protein